MEKNWRAQRALWGKREKTAWRKGEKTAVKRRKQQLKREETAFQKFLLGALGVSTWGFQLKLHPVTNTQGFKADFPPSGGKIELLIWAVQCMSVSFHKN